MIESSVIELLRKSVVPQARESGGTYFVEYGRPFKATAVVAWLIAGAATWLCYLPSTKIQPEAIPVIVGGKKFTFNYMMSGYESLRAEIQRRTATSVIAARE